MALRKVADKNRVIGVIIAKNESCDGPPWVLNRSGLLLDIQIVLLETLNTYVRGLGKPHGACLDQEVDPEAVVCLSGDTRTFYDL